MCNLYNKSLQLNKTGIINISSAEPSLDTLNLTNDLCVMSIVSAVLAKKVKIVVCSFDIAGSLTQEPIRDVLHRLRS